MSVPTELFEGLVDDAAVFPPGNAPLHVAVERHRAHRRARYAGCIGPLLVPASSATELVEETDAAGEPLGVGLIGRPGTDPDVIRSAVATVAAASGIALRGVEVAWSPDWLDLARTLPLDVVLALEVPRGADLDLALADLRARVRAGDADQVVAKFRTGPTPTWAWPDQDELAGFLTSVVELQVPFKLTGGLHHAVCGRYDVAGAPEENHGLLNVVLATSGALEGAGLEETSALLSVDDPEALAEGVAALGVDQVDRVRHAFTSYGCCEVTDPLTELVDLGLLPPDHRPGETA